MTTFVLASQNKHKIREFDKTLARLQDTIGDYRLLSLSEIDFHGDIVEDGTTFEENALIKARTVAKLGYIALADDSGLSVDALGGAPGIFSARYAGAHGDDGANNALLLANLAGKDNRNAHYVCAIACVFPDGREFVVRGECHGRILTEAHGEGGFGYDPLFYYPPFGKTFAEIPLEEKNRVSHRSVATDRLAEILPNYLAKENEYVK